MQARWQHTTEWILRRIATNDERCDAEESIRAASWQQFQIDVVEYKQYSLVIASKHTQLSTYTHTHTNRRGRAHKRMRAHARIYWASSGCDNYRSCWAFNLAFCVRSLLSAPSLALTSFHFNIFSRSFRVIDLLCCHVDCVARHWRGLRLQLHIPVQHSTILSTSTNNCWFFEGRDKYKIFLEMDEISSQTLYV